jgi:hypothetical protein
VHFRAEDINHVRLESSSYDLIYALQSFHHFETWHFSSARFTGRLGSGDFAFSTNT